MSAAITTPPRAALTDRQAEVLALMARGMDFPAIAKHMQVSVETARGHLKQALQALGAANGTHAVALAIAYGLIPATAAIPAREAGASHVRQ